MRILVTGANGFVGRRLTRALAEDHHEVIGVGSGAADPPPGVEWIVQDLSSAPEWRRFPSQVDAIVHLVQSRNYRLFPEKALDIFSVNVASTLHLLDYARTHGARSFVLASSGGVYGFQRDPIPETASANFMNFYQASKFMAESLLAFYSDFFSTMVLRPFFIYGEGQRGMLIANLLERIEQGQPILLHSREGLKTNPVHADDVVQVIRLSLDLAGHHVLNVGGPDVMSLSEVAELLGSYLGKRPRFEHSEGPTTDDLIADIRKLKKVLGYVPAVDLQSGLQRVVEAHLKNGLGASV